MYLVEIELDMDPDLDFSRIQIKTFF